MRWPYSEPNGTTVQMWGLWYVVVDHKLRGGFKRLIDLNWCIKSALGRLDGVAEYLEQDVPAQVEIRSTIDGVEGERISRTSKPIGVWIDEMEALWKAEIHILSVRNLEE